MSTVFIWSTVPASVLTLGTPNSCPDVNAIVFVLIKAVFYLHCVLRLGKHPCIDRLPFEGMAYCNASKCVFLLQMLAVTNVGLLQMLGKKSN